MRKLLLLAFLVSLWAVATPAEATHRSFVWNAPTTNVDATPLTDLAKYRVYTCPGTPCTKAAGTALGEVTAPNPAPTAGTTASLAIPHGKQGMAFVTAIDMAGNESAESNVAPFDTLPPAGSSNFHEE